jgi:hypothetical protein
VSDYLDAALAREGRDFYAGSPEFDSEPLTERGSVSRNPGSHGSSARSVSDDEGLGGAEKEQPERITPVRPMPAGDSTRDSGASSATPSLEARS